MTKLNLFLGLIMVFNLQCQRLNKKAIKIPLESYYNGIFKYKSLFEFSVDTTDFSNIIIKFKNLNIKNAYCDTSFQIASINDFIEFSNGPDIQYRLPIILTSIKSGDDITIKGSCDDCEKKSKIFFQILWVIDIEALNNNLVIKTEPSMKRYIIRSDEFKWTSGSISIKLAVPDINDSKKRIKVTIKEF
jgi:hypothetical protein